MNRFSETITVLTSGTDLGRTAPLISDTEGGMTIIWMTYWKDLEGLRDFAAGDAHRKGWNAYLSKQFPNLGIMHETYNVSNGNWESIYHNFPVFGLGKPNAVFFQALIN